MKKIAAILLAAVMMVTLLTACAKPNDTKNTQDISEGDKTLSVVTTIFPEYDWVRQILGDRFEEAEVTMLLDNGADLHNYQPTADDIIKITDCDLFIYVGGESDGWAEEALANRQNGDMAVINLLETVGSAAKEEEVIEGMQDEEEDGEERPEYDEHVWLSFNNAKVICNKIAEELGKIDSEYQQTYLDNAVAYCEQLTALDSEYQTVCANATTKTLLFGDRFPFRYLVDDYGLNYYAAFVGCSAETEASFETISFLARKTDELGLKYIMTIENSDHKIAETIVQNTEKKNQEILSLDSMQGTTSDDVEAGETYLNIMNQNLDVLKTVLN